jgi:monoamine oxidase
MFIHADRRSKFTPFGVSSDERYHLADGNDGIVAGLTCSVASTGRAWMKLAPCAGTARGQLS